MKVANIIYDNIKDRDLFEVIASKIPIFINFIDFNSASGRKEAYRIKGKWGAKKNPFVEVLDDDKVDKIFYSESGDNAVNLLISYLNGSTN